MIVAGFGFRSDATVASLQSALDRASARHLVAALAAPTDKANATCIYELSVRTGLPVLAIPQDALQACQTITQSLHCQTHRATGSVAEATALAAAGPDAHLLSPRHISEDRHATCALAAKGPK